MTQEPAQAPTRDEINAELARRLVAGQFPQWADLPVRPVADSGWDNRTFHLGEAMIVRLPSGPGYAAQVEKEQRWLRRWPRNCRCRSLSPPPSASAFPSVGAAGIYARAARPRRTEAASPPARS